MSRHLAFSTSPLLASRTPVWRSKLLVALLALGFATLAARAAWVQVFGNAFFQRQGEVRFARTLELPASRGRILDRNGQLLAGSVPAPSIWAIPEDVPTDDARLAPLARLLGLPLPELRRRLADEDKTFVWLRRQVDEPVAQAIAALKLPGIHQRREYRREYPEGEAAAHVVGFTDVELRGLEGVERAFDAELSGRAGSRRVIKDRLGSVIESVGEATAPVDGRDLRLSIDSKIQYFAWQRLHQAVREHKAQAGSVVVLDVWTGELLALANVPSYGPQARASAGAALRNRALTDTFEPGSTMKPFIAALALQQGLVRPETVIQTAPGRITIGGSTISDAHAYGALTVAEIIQKSSNVGTVRMAMQLQPREMWELFVQLGFGQRPELAFPGAAAGRLRPHKGWRPIEQATMSYGYGLSVSLLQLARAYTVFARDGDLVPVTLLHQSGPQPGRRIFEPGHAAAVRGMLQRAAAPGGTGPKAQTIGYSVGGKTGTARKQEGKGYAERRYRGWFVGFAPVRAPRIVVAVMIDEPSAGAFYGGEVAAPVFSDTVQHALRVLGVPPDLAVQPRIVAQAVEESF